MEPLLEERLHRRGAEVAPPHQPLVVLLDDHAGRETDQGPVVGEDPHHVGAPADLSVQALERVGGAQLAAVGGGEVEEREDVLPRTR